MSIKTRRCPKDGSPYIKFISTKNIVYISSPRTIGRIIAKMMAQLNIDFKVIAEIKILPEKVQIIWFEWDKENV